MKQKEDKDCWVFVREEIQIKGFTCYQKRGSFLWVTSLYFWLVIVWNKFWISVNIWILLFNLNESYRFFMSNKRKQLTWIFDGSNHTKIKCCDIEIMPSSCKNLSSLNYLHPLDFCHAQCWFIMLAYVILLRTGFLTKKNSF